METTWGFTEDRNFACLLRIVSGFETRAPGLYFASLPEHETKALAVAKFLVIFFFLSFINKFLLLFCLVVVSFGVYWAGSILCALFDCQMESWGSVLRLVDRKTV